MLKIGLTGGIGSGKSTIAQLFSEFKVPILDADEIARQLVAKNQPALSLIADYFGRKALNADGSLNRDYIRSRVFSNTTEKQKLEAIIHPLVYREIENRVNTLSAAYCIICVPLLIETAMTALVDRILVIDCLPETQIVRVQQRDNLPLSTIQAIIASQATRIARLASADDVINNNDDKHSGLAEKVKKLHNLYLSLSTQGLTRL
jgi:dephospho-CoA kinase